MTSAERKLLDAILHDPRHELTHESDCFACQIAFYVAGHIASCWDQLNNWDELPATNGLEGDTLYRQLERMVAYVLHRRLPGHAPAPGRPRR